MGASDTLNTCNDKAIARVVATSVIAPMCYATHAPKCEEARTEL